MDSFKALRDEKTSMYEDMKNKCFICGLERYTFDKYADGFYNHIERDHQLWNYLYYLFYLENKDATEYNGIESEITKQLDNHDISFFPIMKAISVEGIEEGEEENLIKSYDEKFSFIKESVAEIK